MAEFRKNLLNAMTQVFPLPNGREVKLGDREPRTIPIKDLPHRVVFWGGWGGGVRIVRTKAKGKYAPPPVLHSRC